MFWGELEFPIKAGGVRALVEGKAGRFSERGRRGAAVGWRVGTQTITHWVSLWDVIDALLLLLTGGDLHAVGQ